MPTFVHSKLSVFKLDTLTVVSPPTLTVTDLSTYLDEVTFSTEQELVETTTFGATSKTYLTGFADGSISLSGNWDDTVADLLNDLIVAFRDGDITSVTFEYGPEGGDAGDLKYTGEAVLVSVEKMSAVKDQVKFTAELQITGAVTYTTF